MDLDGDPQRRQSGCFAYCLFDGNHVYAIDIFARLLGEKSFHRLEDWMISKGYKPYDIYNTT